MIGFVNIISPCYDFIGELDSRRRVTLPKLFLVASGCYYIYIFFSFRPFAGDVVVNDPQRRLALPKPKLQNGECPPGFIDYAVNMVHLDSQNLSFVTSSGRGLRETLFYSLFSHLQIYKTRKEMLLALPCINDGALSLDGGMIKKCGIFALGSRSV